MMELVNESINRYVEQHTKPESAALAELNRETNAKVLMPRMLSGHLQGQVLRMLSKMIKPSRILEIGTYTGYSAICLADGLGEGGLLHTVDINDELKPMVSKYLEKAGVEKKVIIHIGNALEVIPKLAEKFDLVFIDADKINYSNYYNLVFPMIPVGGYIIADNVLWSGKVADKESTMDSDTKAIAQFNDKVQQDTRVLNVLLPIRDGLMVMQKIAN